MDDYRDCFVETVQGSNENETIANMYMFLNLTLKTQMD